MSKRKHRNDKKSIVVTISLILTASMFSSIVLEASPAFADSSSTNTQQIADWPTITSVTAGPLVTVTSGVTYQQYSYITSDGPLVAHETRVDITNPFVQIKTVMANDVLDSTDETVHSMANRTGAVAGVNGDYFEMGTAGAPVGIVIDNGQLVHSPSSSATVSIGANNQLTFGKYAFKGQVTSAAGAVFALTGVNIHPISYKDALIVLTPSLGNWEMANNATEVLLQPVASTGTQGTAVTGTTQATVAQPNDQYTVLGVTADENVIDGLTPSSGLIKLIGEGAGASWIANNIKKGDIIRLDDGTSLSSSAVKYAIGGGPMIVQNGALANDPDVPVPAAVDVNNPLTAIGESQDGKTMLMVVFDGRNGSQSIGLTYREMAQYMLYRGMYQAMLFDGGGSTTMVDRLPGQLEADSTSAASDGYERPVGDGLFVYSTAPASPPATVVVHGNQPERLYVGSKDTLSEYVLDQYSNPVPTANVTWSVSPANLATIDVNGTIQTGTATGNGYITAKTANGVVGQIPLQVTDQFDQFTITPNTSLIVASGAVPLTLTATFGDQTWTVPSNQANWSINPTAAGIVDASGVFHASGTVGGSVTISATVGGSTATATVDVSQSKQFVDVDQAWAASAIDLLASKGIVEGIDNTHFGPNVALTRAMCAVLLARTLSLPATTTSYFRDVQSDAWYAGDVNAAANAGLIAGEGYGMFAPDALVTRSEVAVMFNNALHYVHKNPAAGSTSIGFKDLNTVPLWAVPAVNELSAAGIMVGYNGYFDPNDTATRAQVAVLIENWMKASNLLN